MYLSKNNIIVELKKDQMWKYVLVNPLVGNVNLLDEDYYQCVRNLQEAGEQKQEDPAKIERLKQRGYLYLNQEEEEVIAKKVFDNHNKHIQENKRNSYMIIPSNTCPVGCSYCKYQHQLDGRMLSKTDLKKVMDIILNNEKEDALPQKPVLTLYGGQSLADNDQGFRLVKTVLENYFDHFAHISFYTFGAISERYKDLILNSDVRKLSVVFRPRENEDTRESYAILPDKMDASLEVLRVHGVNTVVEMKITENNVEKMPEYVNYFIEKGFTYSDNCSLRFTPTYQKNCTLFNPCLLNYGLYERIFKLYEEYPQMESAEFPGHGTLMIIQNLIRSRGQFTPQIHFCKANWNLMVFDPVGNVFSCHHAVQDPRLGVGNIHTSKGINKTKLQQWRERDIETIEECSGCQAKYLCAGGCSYEALIQKGSVSNPHCQPHQHLIKWAFESLHEDFLESQRYHEVQQEYEAVT